MFIHRKGKIINDLSVVQKFFYDISNLYQILDGVPLKAVEDLSKYELNREIIIDVMRRCIEIMEAAKLDVLAEWDRINEDPFDGLEEDFEKRKELMRVSGEDQN